MKVQTEFKTRKSAIEYLRARGFYKVGTSIGDTVMKNEEFPVPQQYRLIVKYNNGTWHIRYFESILIATQICFRPICSATVKIARLHHGIK